MIENTQGSLDCAKTTVSGSGNNLTVKWNITPKAAFASTTPKNLYMRDIDNSNTTSEFSSAPRRRKTGLIGNFFPRRMSPRSWTIA